MKIALLLVVVALFCLMHTVKMMRLYLIVMDKHISFEAFVPAYLRTTLANLIVPFKLGEIYRVFVLSRMSGSYRTGIISVLIDRFFDTLALVFILVTCQLLTGGHVTIPVIMLMAFIVVIVLLYVIFPSTFRFLNNYIITSKKSKRSMRALRCLEGLNEWFLHVKALVVYRYGIMILFSFVAWILELIVFGLFMTTFGYKYSAATFTGYIESIMTGTNTKASYLYSVMSIVIVAVATVISLIYYLIARKRKLVK